VAINSIAKGIIPKTLNFIQISVEKFRQIISFKNAKNKKNKEKRCDNFIKFF